MRSRIVTRSPTANPRCVGVGELHHHPGAIVELREAEPEWRVGGEVEAVGGDGDDPRGLVGEPHILHRLRAVRVWPHRNPTFGELDVAAGVASADEAKRVASITFEHRRLRLLLELRAHAPIQFERAVETEKAHVVGQRRAFAQRRLGLLRAGHGGVDLEHQRVAAAPEARHQDVLAGLGARGGEREGEQGVRGAQIANLRGDLAGMIGSGDLGCTRNVAPKSDGGLMHRGMLNVGPFNSRVLERLQDRGNQDARGAVLHEAFFRSIGFGALA